MQDRTKHDLPLFHTIAEEPTVQFLFQPGKPVVFSLAMNGAQGELKAFVNTPSETEEDVFLTDVDDDRFAVRFLPKEIGVHYIHIKLNEAHIPGSPLPILIGKLGADPALVFAKGPGLDAGESGKLTTVPETAVVSSKRSGLDVAKNYNCN